LLSLPLGLLILYRLSTGLSVSFGINQIVAIFMLPECGPQSNSNLFSKKAMLANMNYKLLTGRIKDQVLAFLFYLSDEKHNVTL